MLSCINESVTNASLCVKLCNSASCTLGSEDIPQVVGKLGKNKLTRGNMVQCEDLGQWQQWQSGHLRCNASLVTII